MTSYIGLYYPFIHFKDEAWLKLTVLYWDKMARIMPKGYKTEDPDDVKRLIDEGFIKDYEPNEKDVESVGQVFLDLLQKHEADLLSRYDVSKRDSPEDPWPEIPKYMQPPVHGGPSGVDPRLGYVFSEKLGAGLQHALGTIRLAKPDPGGQQWIGMHPKLAFVYNAVLAEHMASTRGLHPLTDEMLDHLTVVGWTTERLAQAILDVPLLHDPTLTESEIEAYLAMVSLQLVIPKGIAHVPIEKIIKLRRQYTSELIRLQEDLHTFASTQEQSMEIEDPQALQDHLENVYTKKLQPELEDLKKQLQWLDIDTITGAMNMSFETPKAMLSLAALAGITALNPFVAVGGAIVLAICKIVGDKHKENEKARQASPAAYLLRLERELKPRELLSWVPGHAAKFGFRQ